MNTRTLASLVSFAVIILPQAGADVVTDWNMALTHCAEKSLSQSPHLVARAFAIAHLGICEAIETTQTDRSHGLSMEAQVAAASAAGFEIVRNILPMGEGEFGALRTRQLEGVPAGAGKEFGLQVGTRVAADWLARRERDNWPRVRRADAFADLLGAQATAYRRPGTSRWEFVIPFVIRSARHFPVEEPFTFYGNRLEPNGRLRGSKTLDLPADFLSTVRTELWTRDALVTWNRIVRALVNHQARDLRANARLFSVLNTALADALLSASHWSVLYDDGWLVKASFFTADDPRELIPPELQAEYNVPPKTKTVGIPIRNYPDWAATLAGAARVVISRQFGEHTPFSVAADSSLDDGAPVPLRDFASVSVAAKEAAVVGILSRRCTRESAVAGFELGGRIGDYVVKRGGMR